LELIRSFPEFTEVDPEKLFDAERMVVPVPSCRIDPIPEIVLVIVALSA
jgi:hypothetical protein